MSLFSWLSPAKPKPPALPPETSGLSRMESTRPYNARTATEPAPGVPANRKAERMARRELLYAVVRENMTKAGVLSASYKFKVLSLDARGRQFLVMVDLSRASGAETDRLAEIEAMIAQSAKTRYDILVSAVYWRMNEHVAVGQPAAPAKPTAKPVVSQPAPLEAEVSMPAALVSAPAPLEPTLPLRSAPLEPTIPLRPVAAAPARAPGRYEAIQNDEVEAFRKALASGVSGAAALAAAGGAEARDFEGHARHGPQSYTLLTGFEDTEMADESLPTPALSSTQYGELR